MSSNPQQKEPWGGSIIEIYNGPVYNIVPRTLENTLYCAVTGMKIGTQVVWGYSSTVTDLESIFGNKVYANVPITLSIEFLSTYDAAMFLAACFESLMAAKSILSGKTIDILFGKYCLEYALVSEASISMQPGTLGATAQIVVIGYRYYSDWAPLSERMKTTRSPHWRYSMFGSAGVSGLMDDTDDKCSLMYTDAYDTHFLSHQFVIDGLYFTFKENIKIIGRDTEYTVYPSHPVSISMRLTAIESPELQSSAGTTNPVLWPSGQKTLIEDTMSKLRGVISSGVEVVLYSPAYGIITALPVDVTTDVLPSMQNAIDLSCIVMRYNKDTGYYDLPDEEPYINTQGDISNV